MTIATLIENYSDSEDILLADGFESAFIGVCRRFSNSCALYDYDKCVNVLVERDKMDPDDAVEYMEYNVVGSYVGDNTPIFLMDKL